MKLFQLFTSLEITFRCLAPSVLFHAPRLSPPLVLGQHAPGYAEQMLPLQHEAVGDLVDLGDAGKESEGTPNVLGRLLEDIARELP